MAGAVLISNVMPRFINLAVEKTWLANRDGFYRGGNAIGIPIMRDQKEFRL